MDAQSGPMPDHYRRVLRFVRRRVGSTEDAEDVTQDVFANAVAWLDQADAPSPKLAWLYTVAKRRIVDEARRRKGLQTVPLELVGEPPASADGYGDEVARALDASLALMPDGHAGWCWAGCCGAQASPSWHGSSERVRRRVGCGSCAASSICAMSSRRKD